MNRQKLQYIAIGIGLLIMLVIVIDLSSGKLPEATKERYQTTGEKRLEVKKYMAEKLQKVSDQQAKYPEYLQKIDQRENLSGQIKSIQKAFEEAENRYDTQAKALFEKDKKSDDPKLLAELDAISTRLQEVQSKTAGVSRRIEEVVDYRENWETYVNRSKTDIQTVQARTYDELLAKLDSAKTDWPEKESDLTRRYQKITDFKSQAQISYDALLAASGSEPVDYVSVGMKSEEIARFLKEMDASAEKLSEMTDELYISIDRILVDMEIRDNNTFFHQYKTITVDRNNAQDAQTTWEQVPQATYERFEENLGMVVQSKPKGIYKSESDNQVSPPGYNYVGNEHYGKWESDAQGQRYWSFYPSYSFLPMLFWGSSLSRPVYYGDYRSYQDHHAAGKTYYGPKDANGKSVYGTNGTVARQTYANSKYVKSGGYASSRYKSSTGSPGSTAAKKSTSSSSRGYKPSSSRSFGGK